MKSESKAWGFVRHVFDSPHAAVSVLDTKTGAFCSRHTHEQRSNLFFVQSGVIEVVEYDHKGEMETLRKRLHPGEVHSVPAGVVHRFEVILGGVVVEVYAPGKEGDIVSINDIQRLDVGGETLQRIAA